MTYDQHVAVAIGGLCLLFIWTLWHEYLIKRRRETTSEAFQAHKDDVNQELNRCSDYLITHMGSVNPIINIHSEILRQITGIYRVVPHTERHEHKKTIDELMIQLNKLELRDDTDTVKDV